MCGNNAFRVEAIVVVLSQGCRCAPTAGLKLANAFGVSNCDTTQRRADLKTLKAFVRLKLRIILFNYV